MSPARRESSSSPSSSHAAAPAFEPSAEPLSFYRRFSARVAEHRELVRRREGDRPLSFTEKILAAHFAPSASAAGSGDPSPWPETLRLRPDRLALQDTTSQMALLQFLSTGRRRASLPATIHCDHLIQAAAGGDRDLARALEEHDEVYRFLASAAAGLGIDFWPPGSGIIHQVILETHARPGGLILGTDSHTPNAGGLAMLGIGVGGAEAAEVLAGLSWTVARPRVIGVRLHGRLEPWVSPKDVILHLCGALTVQGATGAVLEYFGPGAETLEATGKATICNMGAELGATSSVFPYDDSMARYLEAVGRTEVAQAADEHREELRPDAQVLEMPEVVYDQVVEVDLSQLRPQIGGPHSPDRLRAVDELRREAPVVGYPELWAATLIGSCTNSSYEDMRRAAEVARQGLEAGLRFAVPFYVTPGSERVRRALEEDGVLETFRQAGATVLANACGPCIGRWARSDVEPGQTNAILSSYNRNFPGRNDGSAETLSFLASPEIVTACALSGVVGFDPTRDALQAPDGEAIRLRPPAEAGESAAPRRLAPVGQSAGQAVGQTVGRAVVPPPDGEAGPIVLPEGSERLRRLEPFPPWEGDDALDLLLLVKARGKTTTDHLSPAGPWLVYRGNLDRLSDNLYLGVRSAFDRPDGTGKNLLTGEEDLPLAAVARAYQAADRGTIVVGEHNFGEGSSREQAAMSPRHLGVRAILAKSFARIHETNLKKQGLLPLVFVDEGDYDRIGEDDRIRLTGLRSLERGEPLEVTVRHPDGGTESFEVRHRLAPDEIAWFRAGSALNCLNETNPSEAVPGVPGESPHRHP